MFKCTQSILEQTESYILKLPIDNKLWSLFTRYIVFPLKYLWLGLGEFFKPFILWSVISLLLLIALMVAKKNFGINLEYSIWMISFCMYFPMILVIFAVPSTYSYYGVSSVHVKKITQFIELEGIDSIDKVELLEENIKKIYDRVCSRVLFYKWLISAYWALNVVVFNFNFKILMKSPGESMKDVIVENISTISLVLISTIVALLLVVGYKKASDLLIKSIEFGCVEQKYKLLKKD